MAGNTIDVRRASRKAFEDFVFDHEVHGVGSPDVWYHQLDLEILYDPANNARRLIEMFEGARSLLDKYTRAQLEQGCWALFGAGFDGNLEVLIWDSELPIDTKEALIHAMYIMYRDLFAADPLGEACEMWWDGLAYAINPMKRADPDGNSDHKRIQNAMFETLSKIVFLDAKHCQFAALHGLNHVFHPDTDDLVRGYVERNPDLSDEEVEYAAICANGKAL
jgi:hypothetical protein